jgi:hypothetical protein
MTRALATNQRERFISDLNLWFSMSVLLLIGGLVRFLPLGMSTYPLNDGGLFAHMAGDLVRNGFALPQVTTYNGLEIPYAYPPLGIYLTAVIARGSGLDAITVVRWLPAMVSTASVLALYLMAAELLRSRWRGVVAAGAFAVMPRSYLWLIVGGGVTRALGLLFALLALHQGILMLRRHRARQVLGTAAFGGLTALSHPQAAVFLAVSMVILVGFHVFRGRSLMVIGQLLLAGFGALLMTAPWIVAVVGAHGIAPLVSAGRTALDPANGLGVLLGLGFTDTPVLDLMAALGVLGVILRIARRQWMIPLWLALTVMIDPRAGSTFATVPLALSVVPILGEVLQRMIPTQGRSATLESESMPRLVSTHRAATVVIAVVLFVTLRTASRIQVDPSSPLHGLTADHVAAMHWVAANSDADARFAVVTGRAWQADYVSEWFPVLAYRMSLATVQGSEWLGIDAFIDRLAMNRQLQLCSFSTATCFESWISSWNVGGAEIFLPKGRLFGPLSASDCCPALRETLMSSTDYRVMYDGPGATVFAPVATALSEEGLAATNR